jgi:hypothetical protein
LHVKIVIAINNGLYFSGQEKNNNEARVFMAQRNAILGESGKGYTKTETNRVQDEKKKNTLVHMFLP